MAEVARRDAWIAQHMPKARQAAGRYAKRRQSVYYDDLLGEAYLGLVETADKLDRANRLGETTPKYAYRAAQQRVSRWLSLELTGFTNGFRRGKQAIAVREYSDDRDAREATAPQGDYDPGLWELLKRILTPWQREALLLTVDYGYSMTELGKVIGNTQRAAHTRVQAAKRKLRGALEELNYG